MAEVKRLLSGARLVTLTGAAGVGKSRLALQVAEELQPAFEGGVFLVELSGLREPDLVADTVMMTLGVHNRPGWSPTDSVIDHVADQRMLLILDNCEHLVDASTSFVATVLRATGALRVLVTSRRALGVAGEHLWQVPPLSVPDPERPLPARANPGRAALALFEERAAAVVPGLLVTPRDRAVMAGICRRLDGIPLAIELAAVQLRSLSPRQVLDRLDDRFALLSADGTGHHHEMLAATMDWSFSLCTAAEQLMWGRLSIFAGDFDLAAAEHICAGDGIEREDVIHAVIGLVDKSVVLREQHDGQTRLRLLETVREYGVRKLRETDDETRLRIRHRDYYLGLVEDAEAAWFGPDQVRQCAAVRRDHANLRAALEFSRATPGQARAGLRLAARLWFYWVACAVLPEGRHWLEQLLAIEPEPGRERVDALWATGFIANLQGDVTVGSVFHELSRVLAAQLGDDAAVARATSGLGLAALLRDDNRRAIALEYQALERARLPGTALGVSETTLARIYLATALIYQGEIAKGIEVCEQARSTSESSGEQWTLAWCQYVLARAAFAAGLPETALAHAREGLRIHRSFNDQLGVVVNLELLAWITVADGDHGERPAILLGAAHEAWIGFGLPGFGSRKNFEAPHHDCESALRDALGDDDFESAYRRGTRLSIAQAVEYALAD